MTCACRHAFTVLELLLVVAIVVVLAGMLLAGLGVLRERTRIARATSLLQLLSGAMEVYSSEDPQHRYPPICPTDLCLSEHGHAGSTGALGIMDARGYVAAGSGPWDGQRRLLDPWGNTYRYALERPVVGTPTPAFLDWNWDAPAGHERRWGMRHRLAGGTNTVEAGALPFPYLWSLGKGGSPTDGTDWVHLAD